MKKFLLTKVRLSYYFWFFFFTFLGISFIVPGTQFDAGALTLFSVNSFLYGFYIAPILGAQKGRVEELHRIVRSEANALFGIMLETKHVPTHARNEFQAMIAEYIREKLQRKTPNAGEAEYEKIITYCLDYRGRDHEDMDQILKDVVANQKNRTDFAMQVGNRVFANEWQIMAILFSITLGFILSVDIGDTLVLQIIRALLCTGLTMLIVILIKLSTLTHKKAKAMWGPLHKLLTTNFYRID